LNDFRVSKNYTVFEHQILIAWASGHVAESQIYVFQEVFTSDEPEPIFWSTSVS